MSCIHVSDYTQAGWAVDTDRSERSRYYCEQLEQGKILCFRQPPFLLSDEDLAFLVSRNLGDSRLHKNISYRPAHDLLRGFSGGKENGRRLHRLLRDYSRRAAEFVSRFLAPYAGHLQLDYASFRPLEEQGRDLPLHKRNDLLHVDAFPSDGRWPHLARIHQCESQQEPQVVGLGFIPATRPEICLQSRHSGSCCSQHKQRPEAPDSQMRSTDDGPFSL